MPTLISINLGCSVDKLSNAETQKRWIRPLRWSNPRNESQVAATLLTFILLGSWASLPAKAAEQDASAPAPEVTSLFPVGLQRGTVAKMEIRGKHLDGVYSVWFDSSAIKARVEKIQIDAAPDPTPVARGNAPKEEDRSPRQIVLLDATLPPFVTIGKHVLRLIGPGGLSKTQAFLVHSDRAASETAADHNLPQKAQPVSVPLLLEGKLAKPGEVDYYSFDVAAGQELIFHGASGVGTKQGGFDALQFHLYSPGGSWFDPNRGAEIAFSDEPQLKYRFSTAGRYLLAVGAFLGIGGPDFAYQIRIHSSEHEPHAEKLQNSVIDSLDQTFARELGVDRTKRLWARTVLPPPPGPTTGEVASASAGSGAASGKAGHDAELEPAPRRTLGIACMEFHEQEPNDPVAEAQELTIPALVEGTIAHPGDVDSYKFKAEAGQQIALEVETSGASLPKFTPLISVLDPGGKELFTNIWRRVGGDNNEWMKTLQPKTLYKVDKDGEYTLQIRDLVSYQYGDNTFDYRIVIRPQVPHVGNIEVKEDEVNLPAGHARKLHLTVSQEEGYSGDIAVSVDNLPRGVQALPAAEVEAEAGPQLDQGPRERYVPKQREVTVLLVAAADSPATRLPYFAHVSARPVVGGQLGLSLPVRDIPVMVIRSAASTRAIASK